MYCTTAYFIRLLENGALGIKKKAIKHQSELKKNIYKKIKSFPLHPVFFGGENERQKHDSPNCRLPPSKPTHTHTIKLFISLFNLIFKKKRAKSIFSSNSSQRDRR